MLPLLQSLSPVQLVRQPAVVQLYGAHETALAVVQVPPPLQLGAGWKLPVLALQLAVPHEVPADACWQAPPWHRPVFPQVADVVQRASAVPLSTLAQVPLPLMSQAWQVPQLAVVQQTPSTQLPDEHSCATVQTAPAAFLARHWAPEDGQ
jgi:hypothetical protein